MPDDSVPMVRCSSSVSMRILVDTLVEVADIARSTSLVSCFSALLTRDDAEISVRSESSASCFSVPVLREDAVSSVRSAS
jgi:hypothetical protein